MTTDYDANPPRPVAHSGSPQPVPKRVRVVEDTVPDSTERTTGREAIAKILAKLRSA